MLEKRTEHMRDDIYNAAVKLVALMREKKLTFACAESCTGGLISAAITSVAGSSEVFLGGVVSYHVDVKTKLLGVAPDTVRQYGVVSEQCAAEMARGAARAVGADIAVSVTGVAGPGGGSETTPVGTVCFGVASKEVHAFIRRFDAASGREGVRADAVLEALNAALAEANKLH